VIGQERSEAGKLLENMRVETVVVPWAFFPTLPTLGKRRRYFFQGLEMRGRFLFQHFSSWTLSVRPDVV